MQATWVRSLGLEDHLEKGMATHSSVLAWRIPWTEEPGGLQAVHGIAELDMTEVTEHALNCYFSYCINVKLFTYGLQIILQNILHLTFPVMFILQKFYRVSLLEF